MKEVLILFTAVLIDSIMGDPYWLPHPIIFIGNMIKKYEGIIRRIKFIPLKIGGFILTIGSIITVMIVIFSILFIANIIHPVLKLVIMVYLLYTSLAGRCLHLEGNKVYESLIEKDIEKSRKLLSYLVGRDTSELTLQDITRGIVETIAENTVDGVLAPVFYIIIGFFIGMPVEMAFLYKTINTLDSMVGYKQEPYKDIGYASAKLDDIANYIPARLGSLLMLGAGGILGYDIRRGLKILIRDRRNHKSPNCGYPESAVAGMLNIQLGGTNTYFGERVYKPTIGDDVVPLEPKHIKDTVRIMYGAQVIMITGFLLIQLIG